MNCPHCGLKIEPKMTHADRRNRRAEIASFILKHPDLTYGAVAKKFGLKEAYIGEIARAFNILRKPTSGNWK